MKILSAEYLLPMSSEVLMDGAVAIENDEIIDVGREEDLLKRYPDAEHENFPHHVILPGLINAHAHLDMSLYKDFSADPVRQLGARVNFVDWLMGCLDYKRRSNLAQLREAVEWAIDESLQAGTTCVAEMGNYEGIFAVLEQKNMRAVVFPEVISFDSSVSKDLFESALAIVEKYQDEDSDLITVGMGPYSPFTLSRNILRIMSHYSRSSNLPLMIHVAGSFSEMEFFHDSTGDIASKLFPNIGWDELPPPHQRTPIQHLSEIGFLDCRPILVGCVQTTDSDLDLIARSGSKIVITTRAGNYLQQGQPDMAKILERRIVTALGTDGIPSVDSLSLWDEMRAFVEYHEHRLPLTGHQVLSMVTSHAAMALGLENDVGSLEKGKRADLLVVDISSIPTGGDLAMNLIKRVRDSHVQTVMVGGHVVKSMN